MHPEMQGHVFSGIKDTTPHPPPKHHQEVNGGAEARSQHLCGMPADSAVSSGFHTGGVYSTFPHHTPPINKHLKHLYTNSSCF